MVTYVTALISILKLLTSTSWETVEQIISYREETLLCIQHSLLHDNLNEDVDPVHIAPTCPAAPA